MPVRECFMANAIFIFLSDSEYEHPPNQNWLRYDNPLAAVKDTMDSNRAGCSVTISIGDIHLGSRYLARLRMEIERQREYDLDLLVVFRDSDTQKHIQWRVDEIEVMCGVGEEEPPLSETLKPALDKMRKIFDPFLPF